MHYSQLQSAVESSVHPGHESDTDLFRLHLQGFMDAGMLDARIGELTERIQEHMPRCVLVDLRAVAGYGPGTPALAREWLTTARRMGVRRVALIASSSVLRTAALMLGRNLGLQLRCFLGEAEALRWLESKN